MTTPYQSHPTPQPLDWPNQMTSLRGHTRIGDVLPRGALTLLELHDDVNPNTHPWRTAVPPLIRVILDEELTLFYVEAGGRQPAGSPLGEYIADACQDNARFRAHADYDVHVPLPAHLAAGAVPPIPSTVIDGPRDPAYDCNIPTLSNIKADLAAHDAAQGDAVVLFDQVEFMRPYYLPPLPIGGDVPYSACTGGAPKTCSTSPSGAPLRRSWSAARKSAVAWTPFGT